MAVRSAARLAVAAIMLATSAACGAAPAPAQTPTASPPPSASPSVSLVPRACSQVQQLAGGIEGRVAYVTGGAVRLVIYAIRVGGGSSYRVVHYAYDLVTRLTTYTILGVEPGTYVVVATPADERGQARPGAILGSYTASDHTPAHISVAPGGTSRGVDVVDWSDQPKGFPALPSGGEPYVSGDRLAVCNPFADEVNLRSSPGTASTIVRTVPNGTELKVIDGPRPLAGYDWYAVQLDAAVGWVVGYALRR